MILLGQSIFLWCKDRLKQSRLFPYDRPNRLTKHSVTEKILSSDDYMEQAGEIKFTTEGTDDAPGTYVISLKCGVNSL